MVEYIVHKYIVYKCIVYSVSFGTQLICMRSSVQRDQERPESSSERNSFMIMWKHEKNHIVKKNMVYENM